MWIMKVSNKYVKDEKESYRTNYVIGTTSPDVISTLHNTNSHMEAIPLFIAELISPFPIIKVVNFIQETIDERIH